MATAKWFHQAVLADKQPSHKRPNLSAAELKANVSQRKKAAYAAKTAASRAAAQQQAPAHGAAQLSIHLSTTDTAQKCTAPSAAQQVQLPAAPEQQQQRGDHLPPPPPPPQLQVPLLLPLTAVTLTAAPALISAPQPQSSATQAAVAAAVAAASSPHSPLPPLASSPAPSSLPPLFSPPPPFSPLLPPSLPSAAQQPPTPQQTTPADDNYDSCDAAGGYDSDGEQCRHLTAPAAAAATSPRPHLSPPPATSSPTAPTPATQPLLLPPPLPPPPLPDLPPPPLPPDRGWVGRRVRRFYDMCSDPNDVKFVGFDGAVTEFIPAGEDGTEDAGVPAMWQVVHDDGDEEQLEECEVEAALRHHDSDMTWEDTQRSEYERLRMLQIEENAKMLEGLGIPAEVARMRRAARAARARAARAETAQPRMPRELRFSERHAMEVATCASAADTAAVAAHAASRVAHEEQQAAAFRPTDEADAAMQLAVQVSRGTRGVRQPQQVVAWLEGQPAAGPFVRNENEVSGERVLEMVAKEEESCDEKLYDVDPTKLDENEHIVIGVKHKLEVRGACENDYAYILHRLPVAAQQRSMRSAAAHLPWWRSWEGVKQEGFWALNPCMCLEPETVRAAHLLRSIHVHAFDQQTAAHYLKIKSKIDNAWHEQAWSRWTNDPCGKLRRSTEVCTLAPCRMCALLTPAARVLRSHTDHANSHSLLRAPLHVVRLVRVHRERGQASGSQEVEEALQAERVAAPRRRRLLQDECRRALAVGVGGAR